MLLTTTENCGCGIGREKSFESSAVEIDSLKINSFLSQDKRFGGNLGKLPWNAAGSIDNH
ncbi:hypothetical protein OUZ56_014204 [Daphnia magna]|uniref:Uncharacterized protein n=1 Tax=Daphnia magna TaxID=35525 RepID=A0ABQ9Z843_9CRUS|nr:hypothetical protein OUZ56_014204 [Daphnia magna]